MKKIPVIPVIITAPVLVFTLLGDTVDIFMDLSFNNALELAAEEDRVVMVKFHADWCTWCRKMDRKAFTDPGIKELLKQFIPVRVDVDQNAGLTLAQRVGVVNIPAIVFFDASGEVIGKYVGYQSPREMAKILKRHTPDETL